MKTGTIIGRLALGLGIGASLALSLLTVTYAPALTGWKLAVLETEFGHWLWPVPAVLAVFAWRTAGPRWWRGLLAAGGAAAVALLLSPAVRGAWLARAVETRWRQSPLAAAAPSEPLFRAGELWWPTRVAPTAATTHVFRRADDFELSLDFYRAAPGGRPAPCVVVIHGGGWDSGDRAQLPELNHELAARGYAVATIDYRLAPRWRWPAPREDVAEALRWLREHAAELGLAPDRFVLLGRSAGAQIALAAAYAPGVRGIAGVISFYGPADMHFAYVHGTEDDVLRSPSLLRAFLGGSPETAREAYDDASPYLHVRRDLPATLLIHGRNDTLVWHRQSERLAARLEERGAPVFFVSLPWATHACDYNLHGPGGQMARGLVLRFLAGVTREPENKSGDR